MDKIFNKDNETICAVSTAAGRGGIAVIRVSGENALKFLKELCPFIPKNPESHRIYYGRMREFGSDNVIDEVLVSFFARGRSYTGEQTLEISCHGGEFVCQKIVNELLKVGCRHAEKGEFTYRAFMNGKLDLVQAESVLALIESESKRTARQAIRQLDGELSQNIEKLENELISIGAHLEANIDFSSEDIVVEDNLKIAQRMELCQANLRQMLSSFEVGKFFKAGFQVVLIGRPNAGKSSLLNSLVAEERAIVTEIPGTTRDLVEGFKLINGVRVKFLDTAGIHKTNDPVERLGIDRALSAAKQADLVLCLHDISSEVEDNFSEIRETLPGKICLVLTKVDLIADTKELHVRMEQCKKAFQFDLDIDAEEFKAIALSSHTGDGISEVEALIGSILRGESEDSSLMLINSRHYEELTNAEKNISSAIELIRKNESPEFMAFEIKSAVVSLQRLLGRVFDDQIMDRVFQEFCLGK